MRSAPLVLLAALAMGCPEDPTHVTPMTELKPVTGPPPIPVAPKQTVPLPEPVAPSEPAPKHSAETAPVKFTLGRTHRANLDQLPMLPRGSSSMEISHWPVLKYSTAEDLKLGRAPSMLDWSIMLFAKKAGTITVRMANKKEQWPGGEGWLAVVLDASRTAGFDKLAMGFPGSGGRATAPEIGNLNVDEVSSFRVRSLAGQKTWKLTIGSNAAADEVVVPAIALLPDRQKGAAQVTINGKPVVKQIAVLPPGSYTLSGADSLFMFVPAVDGMKIAELEVELAAP